MKPVVRLWFMSEQDGLHNHLLHLSIFHDLIERETVDIFNDSNGSHHIGPSLLRQMTVPDDSDASRWFVSGGRSLRSGSGRNVFVPVAWRYEKTVGFL